MIKQETAMKTLSHNAFARHEIVRERVGIRDDTDCSWCGRVKSTKNGSRYLFRYGIQADSLVARINWLRGLFCSKGCAELYAEVDL